MNGGKFVKITFGFVQFIREARPRCKGLNPAKTCSLRRIFRRKVNNSRAVQILVKLGWLAAAAAPGAAGVAALSTVWNRRSNHANFNSQLGHTSGFNAIFSRETQRFDSCSPELLAVAAASFTCNSVTIIIINNNNN